MPSDNKGSGPPCLPFLHSSPQPRGDGVASCTGQRRPEGGGLSEAAQLMRWPGVLHRKGEQVEAVC